MISKINAIDLHGLYNYSLSLSDGVNIITGPNGYGKTTILKIINNLLSCNLWYFQLISFTRIELYFSGNDDVCYLIRIEKAVVEEEQENDLAEEKRVCSFTLYTNEDKEIESFTLPAGYISRLLNKSNVPYFTDETSDLESVLEREYDIDNDPFLRRNGRNFQMFLQQQNHLFVKEHRIDNIHLQNRNYFGGRQTYKTYVIDDIACELKDMYSAYQDKFAKESQKIDASFIKRLINTEFTQYNKEELIGRINELKVQIDKFRLFSLVSDMEMLEEYPEDESKAVSLYIDDMHKKLSVYEDFYNKLETLQRLVSDKQLSDKNIEFNPQKGLCVYNKMQTYIPLNKLSSGEQNIIILYFRLVFSAKQGSISMIDEPENSLHVAWLSHILDDYIFMAEKLHCQILIATHSPTFINGKWELTTDLYESDKRKA